MRMAISSRTVFNHQAADDFASPDGSFAAPVVCKGRVPTIHFPHPQ
jgi:hypothetical protein